MTQREKESLFAQGNPDELPAYKREFIEWLENYKFTALLVRYARVYRMTPEEVSRLKASLTGALLPKENPTKSKT